MTSLLATCWVTHLPAQFIYISWVPHLRDSLIVAKVGSAAANLFISATAAAGPVLIATLWQGLALAAITALCLRILPRSTAVLRFTLWATALFLICVLPSAFPGVANTPNNHVLHADPRWSLAVAAAWFTLSLLRAVDLVRHALRLRSLGREATPIPVEPTLAALLQTHRGARLCTSTQLDRPGVIGFLHPRILIPAWLFAQLTAPELEQIVLHELEHLRRRDDWLNLLQKLALVVFPLNPALHWIERQLCLERELACDEGVIRRTRAPRLYATCLTQLAEYGLSRNTTAGRALSLALGFLERQSELARRVTGILHGPRTLSARQSTTLTATVAALLLGASAELARCPQLVAFTAFPIALSIDAGAPHLAPETWVSPRSATSFVYSDAAAPHLLHTALTQSIKPLHRKVRIRRPNLHAPQQRAAVEQVVSTPLVANSLNQPVLIPNPVTPTLVRYTLVRVDGGWLLLQL